MGWQFICICLISFFCMTTQGADHAKDIQALEKLRHSLSERMPGYVEDYKTEKNVFDLGEVLISDLAEIIVAFRKDGSIDANKTLTAASEIEHYNKEYEAYIPRAWNAYFSAIGLVAPSFRGVAALDNLERFAS